jgi:hypothetical protein
MSNTNNGGPATSIEEAAARAAVAANHCQGACDAHSDDVKLVAVKGWGFFAYCEAAISEDESRGLSVERLTP